MRSDSSRSAAGRRRENSDYGEDSDHRRVPDWLQLAQSYVLYQKKHPEKTPPRKGLRMGTIFYELYQPYVDPWDDDYEHTVGGM